MNNIEFNKIFHGNCLDIMKNIPDNSLAGCITDPPYNYEFFGHKWDYNEIERRKQNAVSNKSTLVKHIPYGSGLAGGVRNPRWYENNRKNILEYRNWIEEWGNELYRILKPGAYVLTFNSSRTIAHVQVGLENCGFYARDIFVWIRNSGIPKGLNAALKMKKMGYEDYEKWYSWHSAVLNRWEAISVVQKPLQNNYIETLDNYDVGLLKAKREDGSFLSNIFENYKRDKKDEFNQHITIKPKDLIKDLIELTIPINENNIIIDPFIGSGTTAIAALELGVKFIGCEIVKEYVDTANERIKLAFPND